MAQMRLNRFLALAGVAARRKCEVIIGAGRVSVNGEIVSTPARIIDSSRDVVELDGRVVRPAPTRRLILLNKPPGVLSTVTDPHGRPTVVDLLPVDAGRLYPAGRLDSDTTGLVLLTDDGRLAFRVMHPRYSLPKQYLALVKGVVRPDAIASLVQGLSLDDGPARALDARLVLSDGRQSVLRLALGEGRKRQVRRMCGAVGHPVLALHRDAMGPLRLEGLAEGAFRDLTALEARALKRAVGLGDF